MRIGKDFELRLSFLNRDRYTTNDLIRDLVSDDINILNHKYRCNGGGFRIFFRMSPTQFEKLLVKIKLKLIKKTRRFEIFKN